MDLNRAFPVLLLRITIKARETIQLPPYKGSALRGAFGKALKGLSCVGRSMECSSCPLKSSCFYCYMFETILLLKNEDEAKRYGNAPHPFVLRLELDKDPTILNRGDTWNFGMILIGKATRWLPHVIAAFQRMGEMGIGKGRGTFDVCKVVTINEMDIVMEKIFDGRFFKQPEGVIYPKVNFTEEHLEGKQGLFKIEFITPLRIKFRGRFIKKPEFHILVGSLIQRIENLARFHTDLRFSIPVKRFVEKASSVEIVDDKIMWFDWQRYSNRQKSKMLLGGLVGSVVYKGNISCFKPFIDLGVLVHVGKATSFGLGRYSIEVMS